MTQSCDTRLGDTQSGLADRGWRFRSVGCGTRTHAHLRTRTRALRCWYTRTRMHAHARTHPGEVPPSCQLSEITLQTIVAADAQSDQSSVWVAWVPIGVVKLRGVLA
jgi:hypothetical protein